MAFTYKDYTESEEVKRRRQEAEAHSKYTASDSVNLAKKEWDAHSANKVADWTGGTYGQNLRDSIDKIHNREKFTYNLNGDALYQQYKDQYINKGRLAMQDTMGQAAALTGGYGSSYATTAGNQAYQGYLQNLNSVVPELYQLALDKYNQEGQDMYNKLGMFQDAYNTEYGEYRDKVSDWYNEESRLSDRYYNEANMDYNRFSSDRDYYYNAFNNERTYDYGKYSDDYNRAFSNYQQSVSEAQFAQQLALQQAQLQAARSSGGSGGGRSSRGSSSGSGSSGSSGNSTESKATYAGWDAMDWNTYFTKIRLSDGASASQAELNRMIQNGYISKDKLYLASLGARGKSGH